MATATRRGTERKAFCVRVGAMLLVGLLLWPVLSFGQEEQQKPPRQVRVTARILEWTHDNTLDWGFTAFYENPDANEGNAYLSDAFAIFPKQTRVDRGLTLFIEELFDDVGDFRGVIEALEQLGKVHILSQPSIVAVCQADYKARFPEAPPPKESTVSTKSEVPYATVKPVGNVLVEVTEFKDTALVLKVAVKNILQDVFVHMDLMTEVTELTGMVSVAVNEQGDPLPVPQMDQRMIDNEVLVRDKTLFLAGFLKTTSAFRREQGVPWLHRIPILGYLFKNFQRKDSDQELLFLIRPEILLD
ncbi:type II and III secretion system protein [bacterium]|nr:type II and III secretion system protein [bacterium]